TETEAPEAKTEAAEAPASETAETKTEGQAPEGWEGDFDADRAKSLIEKLRSELKETKGRLGEKEEAEKSEYQKLMDRASKAEKELETARMDLYRLRAQYKHGLTDEHMEFIAGATEEEINSRAEKL